MGLNKENFRKNLADEFILHLEKEGLEWKKGWIGSSSQPISGTTSRRYRGVNALYLSLISLKNGYKDPRWYTMNQIIDSEGKYHKGQKWHLKKGSKAVYVEYWSPYDIANRRVITWEEYNKLLQEGHGEEEYGRVSRYTPVFSAENIEGIPEFITETALGGNVNAVIEKIREGMKIEVKYDGNDKAYYDPNKDIVHLPNQDDFLDSYQLNATMLHELSHATGHKSRLDRFNSNSDNIEDYAYEELVAEISSCFVHINCDPDLISEHLDNHKAYVSSWIKAIKTDPDIIVCAVTDAGKCADYMEYCGGILDREEYVKRGGKIEEKEEASVMKTGEKEEKNDSEKAANVACETEEKKEKRILDDIKTVSDKER